LNERNLASQGVFILMLRHFARLIRKTRGCTRYTFVRFALVGIVYELDTNQEQWVVIANGSAVPHLAKDVDIVIQQSDAQVFGGNRFGIDECKAS